MSILNNTTNLQSLLEQVNALPEAGTALPTLSNEGTASDMLSGKQLIDSDGEIVTGTIPTKTSSNLTASGATVTVPAGYYASQATKSVSTATQATPSVSIDSAGKITASATQTAGYVSAGTKTGTKQLTTKAAATITPTESTQTAVAKNVYTTGAVTVGAIPDGYLVGDEISAQDTLIADIKSALQGKAAGGSGGGGSSGGVEYEIVAIPAGVDYFQINYSLPRITSAIGGYQGEFASELVEGTVLSVDGNFCRFISDILIVNRYGEVTVTIEAGSDPITYENGQMTGDLSITTQNSIDVMLINDPTAEAISN